MITPSPGAASLGPLGVAVLLALVGCGNPCESVCDEMAAVARQCQFQVSGGDIERCVSAQEGVDRDTRRICRDYGDREVIREAWTCETVGQYFRERNEQ